MLSLGFFFQKHCREQGSLFLVIVIMYSDVMGRVILLFQKSNREQGSLFLVIVIMYSDVMGRVILLFQKSNREQGSLFLVIFAMYRYSNLMGRGGGGVGYVSFRLIAENKDHCFS